MNAVADPYDLVQTIGHKAPKGLETAILKIRLGRSNNPRTARADIQLYTSTK